MHNDILLNKGLLVRLADDSVVKNTCCSSRGPDFSSKNSHLVALVPGSIFNDAGAICLKHCIGIFLGCLLVSGEGSLGPPWSPQDSHG